jgi:hypothetical protein
VPLVRREKRTSALPRLSLDSSLSAESRVRGPRSRSRYDDAVAAGTDAARHAGTLYRKALAWLRHPVRKVEAEAHHLHEVEREGESGETPFIAILGIVFFLLPIVLLVLGLAFGAYYLAR